MDALRILFVSSEVAPFAKVGGLGDVSGALPKALARRGHDVRVLMPLYQQVNRSGLQDRLQALGVPLGDGESWCGLHEGRLPGSDVPIYFLEHQQSYDRPGVYTDHGDACRRYALLSRAALQLCRALGWTPDLIHANDWQTALLPAYLNSIEAGSELQGIATLLTIHNLAYQGEFGADELPATGLPWELYRFDGFEHHGHLNLLKGGLYHATLLSTVSPTYAREIQDPRFGQGLDPVLRQRSDALFGILNGIDDEVWDPSSDGALPARFDADELAGKALCKAALQHEFHLPPSQGPLVGFIGRLVGQKGIDVIAEALPRLLDLDLQFVFLGQGEPWAHEFFGRFAHERPDRFAVYFGYDEGRAHRIEAGSDLFLMPSHFEPCGLNQMYSMRYGTLPIVHATGGLEDTVQHYHDGGALGTGFKVWDLDADALRDAVHWAVRVYRDRPELFDAMRRHAMRQDFSWRRAAHRYEDLYRLAIARRHGFA